MATYANTTFGTYEDVLERLDDDGIEMITLLKKQEERRAVVDTIMVNLKEYELKPRLIAYLANKYPGKSEEIVQLYHQRIQRIRDMRGRTRFLEGNNAIVNPDGDLIDRLDEDDDEGDSITTPEVYFEQAAPTNGTSGTQAGTAKNGAFLVDTENNKVYINRGTLTSPTWAAWTISGLIDLILNPTELTDAFCYGVIWKLYEKGKTKHNNAALDRMVVFRNQEKDAKKVFEEKLCQAFERLDVDLSGDGLISEYEQPDQGEEESFW